MTSPTVQSTGKRLLKWLAILASVLTVIALIAFAYLAALFSNNFM